MKRPIYLVLLVSLLTMTLLAGCGGSDPNSPGPGGTTITPFPSPTPGKLAVYTAGYTLGSPQVPCYWTNTNKTDLPTQNNAGGQAKSIFVSDKIYVAGNSIISGHSSPCYWAAGSQTILNSSNGEALSIFVTADNTVYTAGYYNTGVNNKPYLWKNTTQTVLDLGFSPEGEANSVFVSGSTPYTTGEIWNNSRGGFIPCFWTDNLETDLDNTRVGYSLGIFCSGNTVYTGGYYWNGSRYVPCYWEGNVRHDLDNDGVSDTFVRSIFVSGGFVYCAGYYKKGSQNIPCYWTGAGKTDLESSVDAKAYSIYVAGSSVYVSGYYNTHACYWVDGVRTDLLDGSVAYSIFVK